LRLYRISACLLDESKARGLVGVQRPLAPVGLLGLFNIAPDLDTLLARLHANDLLPD
jgi:hypothetical protein